MSRSASRYQPLDSVVEDAVSLWDVLRKHGLDPAGYDEGLVESLNATLKLGDGDIRTSLQESGVTAERFLLAFIDAIHPFSEMVADSLSFLESHQVGKAGSKVALRFMGTFGRSKKINLDALRRSVERVESIEQEVRELSIDAAKLYRLVRPLWSLSTLQPSHQIPPPFSDVAQALANGPWPIGPVLRPAPLGVSALDEGLEQLFRLIDIVVSHLRESGFTTREAFRDRQDAMMGSTHELASLASDFWASNLYAQLVVWMNEYRTNSAMSTVDVGLIESVIAQLDELPRTPRRELDRRPVKVFLDILDLPLWRARHELYAFWVLSEIGRAIGPHDLRLTVKDGQLDLRFKATTIGTLRTSAGTMFLMAEVRTKLANPIGKGRRAGVQPDYQISYSPTSDANAARLLIECKQYAKAARKPFTAVLFDYCRACPDAAVLLVNYGPIPENLLTQAEIEQCDIRRELSPEQCRSILMRARTIPKLIPGNPASRQAFTKALCAALPSVSHDSSSPHTVILDVSPSMHPIDPSAVERAIKRQCTGAQPQWILAVDSSVRRMYRFSVPNLQAACEEVGRPEELVRVLETIKLRPEEVIIVTDATGQSSLSSTQWASRSEML